MIDQLQEAITPLVKALGKSRKGIYVKEETRVVLFYVHKCTRKKNLKFRYI